MRKRTNPNGANQYLVDPRQALFLKYYLDPKSETFSNGFQSALRAGYEPEYAKALFSKMPTWLAENVNSAGMIQKAERNLNEILDLETTTDVITNDGPLVDEHGKALKKNDANLLRIKADTSKFVAERLHRKKYGKEENTTTNNVIVVNVSSEGAKKYAIDPTPITDTERPASV